MWKALWYLFWGFVLINLAPFIAVGIFVILLIIIICCI